MNPASLSPELHFACETAREAAELAESIRLAQDCGSLVKADRSPVTVADFSIQALIAARLKKKFPKDNLVAEEESAELRKPENQYLWDQVQKCVHGFLPEASEKEIFSWIERGGAAAQGRYWVLDPIDGTNGFLKGEQYAVALALIENGTVKIGVLACPNLKEGRVPNTGGIGTLAFAEKGKGAWRIPLKKQGVAEPLKVSECTDPSQAVLLRSSDERHMDVEKTQKLLRNLGVLKPPVEMSSLAKHVLLAAAGADFFLRLLPPKNPNYREKIWDQAPGLVLIEEAGGLLTDTEGKPLDFTRGRTLAENRGLLGANARLHPKILSALQKI